MAASPLPILLGVGALLLLKSKGKGTPATATTSETDVGGGAASGGTSGAGTGSTSAGSSGYKNVSIAKMKVIQQQLVTLGHNPGPIDGKWKFGGSTYAAVKVFQGTVGLLADGKPGPNTQAKLNELTDSTSGEDAGSSSGTGSGTGTGSNGDPSSLPSIANNQVGFNFTATEYVIGVSWKYSLQSWLNIQRKAGWLVTKNNEVDPDKFEDTYTDPDANQFRLSMLNSISAGGPMEYALQSTPVTWTIEGVGTAVNYIQSSFQSFVNWAGWGGIGSEHQKLIDASGARATYEWTKTHSVVVTGVSGPVKITDLPRTPAVVEFLAHVEEQVTYFQKMQFED